MRALKAPGKTTYVALHANHPRELTPPVRAACARIVDAGIPMVSQSVLLRGVNDDAETLEALMRAFVECRIKPYYLHHADLAPGTAHFRTTHRGRPGADARAARPRLRASRSRPMCSTFRAATARCRSGRAISTCAAMRVRVVEDINGVKRISVIPPPKGRSRPSSTGYAEGGERHPSSIKSTLDDMQQSVPPPIATEAFTDAAAAVARLDEIYERNTGFLRDRFEAYARWRAAHRARARDLSVRAHHHRRATRGSIRGSPTDSSPARACTRRP